MTARTDNIVNHLRRGLSEARTATVSAKNPGYRCGSTRGRSEREVQRETAHRFVQERAMYQQERCVVG